jgi:arylsulfatase A-like enzyme
MLGWWFAAQGMTPFLNSQRAALFVMVLFVLLMADRSSATAPSVPSLRDPVETHSRPNIVVFYLDDVAPHDGRLWSDPARTPALHDTFIAHGTDFRNAFGETPLCCPGRVSLLTGLHTHNHGVYENDPKLFMPDESIGAALQRVGYTTIFIGKYLNRNGRLNSDDWSAHQSGWTHHDVIRGRNGAFYDYTVRTKNGDIDYGSLHSTEMIAERAIARLRETPSETPVFAILSVFNAHLPNEPMPRFADDERCASIPPWNPPNFNEADLSDKPTRARSLPLLPYSDGWPMVTYCREILGVDWLVDAVINELRARGRVDNTLLVLTADNGMTWGAHRLGQRKAVPYATAVPLYMSWASRWGDEPRIIDQHTSNIDLAPTFCDVGGCALGPYPSGQLSADGVSLLPLLDGETATLSRDALLEQMLRWRAVRTTEEHELGLWHYVEYDSGEVELYDVFGGPCHAWEPGLPGDPCEMQNLAGDAAYQPVRDALAVRLHELLMSGRLD